jgi:hypothetical protein
LTDWENTSSTSARQALSARLRLTQDWKKAAPDPAHGIYYRLKFGVA